jgi:protein phosphatase
LTDPNDPSSRKKTEDEDTGEVPIYKDGEDTGEIPVYREESRPGPPPAPVVTVDATGLSHRGRVRLNNEDHYLVSRVGRMMEILVTNLPEGELPARVDDTGYVMMVADGMGGPPGGEVASRLAISTLVRTVLDVPDWIMRPDDASAEEVLNRAVEYYRKVDAKLTQRGADDPSLTGMGTTMTVAYSAGTHLFIAHVGDSRAYLYRGGSLQQLTRDHNSAQMLADAGIIAREGKFTDRLRHVLTNVLGATKAPASVEVHRLRLEDGDRILLCTDGLTGMVDDAAISAILERTVQSEQACRSLVDLALENGGHDNVTAVMARYQVAGPRS